MYQSIVPQMAGEIGRLRAELEARDERDDQIAKAFTPRVSKTTKAEQWTDDWDDDERLRSVLMRRL